MVRHRNQPRALGPQHHSIGSTGVNVGTYGRILTRSGTGWVVENAGPGSDYTFAEASGAKDGVEWSVAGGSFCARCAAAPGKRRRMTSSKSGGILPIDATHA